MWNAPSAQLGNYPDRYDLPAIALVCHRLAQRQGRRPGLVRSVSPLQQRERRPLSDLQRTARRCASHVLNTPLEVQEYLDANLGLYAQDSWNLGKLTVNFGLRFDHVKTAHRRPGRADRAGSPTWRRTTTSSCRCGTTSRRALSVVYNVFGNGKTAIRGGFNKFMTAQTTGFAQLYNPTALDDPGPGLERHRTATTSPTASAAARYRGGLRDRLRRPAVELRGPLAGARSIRISSVRISWPTTSASRTKC